MRWFKHDTDANQDSKLQNVLLDYGLEGYGLYWYCIELIAGRIDKDNLTFELEHDARVLARNTGSTAQRVEEMMRYFVKIGLFENSEGVVTCLKLAKRLDQSMTSNPKMRELINNLRRNNHDPIMTQSDKVMQDKIRLDQIRLEESRSKTLVEASEKPKASVCDYSEQIKEVFEFWKETMGKNNQSKLTPERKKHVRARLKDGYPVGFIKQAIYGCSITPHNIGHNDSGKRFDDLTIITRNGSQLERFASNAQQSQQTHSVATATTIQNIQDLKIDN